MKHYYFCAVCGDAPVLPNKEELSCQGDEAHSHEFHPLTHLGRGKKGKQRQQQLSEGYQNKPRNERPKGGRRRSSKTPAE